MNGPGTVNDSPVDVGTKVYFTHLLENVIFEFLENVHLTVI